MRIHLTIAALLLAASPAFAADLAPRATEPAAPESPPSWSGFYVGAHGGAVFGQGKLYNSYGSYDSDKTGFIGGLHAGYNAQFGNVVLGVEGDIDVVDLLRTHYANGHDSVRFQSDVQGSIRARAGYAFGAFLPYVTGGLALAQEEYTLRSTPIGLDSTVTKTLPGFTVGGGVEYAIDPNWIVRGEVRYTDFGSSTYVFPVFPAKSQQSETTTEVGVSYKF